MSSKITPRVAGRNIRNLKLHNDLIKVYQEYSDESKKAGDLELMRWADRLVAQSKAFIAGLEEFIEEDKKVYTGRYT